MAKGTIIMHLDWQAFLDRLSDEQLGQWTRAVLRFMSSGEIPSFSDQAVEVAFYSTAERISRDQAAWDRKISGLKQYQSAKSNQKQAATDRKPPYGLRTGGVPVPVPVPVPISSSIDDDSTGSAGTTMTAFDELIQKCQQGGIKTTPFAATQLAAACQKLSLELVDAIIINCIANGARNWTYVQKALQKAMEQGLHTVAEYEAQHQRSKANVIDREQPSGNDYLRGRGRRPLKLKQEE